MPESGDLAIHVRALVAVASPSRMRVLRTLRERRRTASEVAEVLRIRRGGAQRHLLGLAKAGFVRRHEDGERVWVYYSLTREGRHLVESERPRVALLLATTVAALAAVLTAITWEYRQYTRAYPGAWSGQHIHNPPSFVNGTIIALLALAALLVAASATSALRLRQSPEAVQG